MPDPAVPNRDRDVAPIACAHASACAGCPSIDLDYDAQLAAKHARVHEAFARYPALRDIAVDAVIAAEPRTAYRTRAKLSVGTSAEGRAALGLFDRAGTHRTIDIPECRAVAPALLEASNAIRALIASPPDPLRALFTPVDRGGALHAVDLRETRAADGRAGALVTLVLDEARHVPEGVLLEASKRMQHDAPCITSVAIALHAANRPTVLGGVPHVVLGPLTTRDTVAGRVYVHATHGGFVQAHRPQAARMYARIADLVAQRTGGLTGRKIVDAYAGAGALGLVLASRGARVRMIESFAPAAEQASEAARAQGLQAVATIGDAGEVLTAWARENKRPDAVVLNPPRRGVSPDVRDAVGRLAPRVVVYMSCEPASLARDLDHLARMGYTATRAEPFDLMPQTPEVETIVLATKGPLPAPRVLHDAGGCLFVDKPPHEPVTPQGEHAFSLVARIHDALVLPDATAVHRLDEGSSGIVLVARDAKSLPSWSDAYAREDCVKSYLVLVRGITREKGTVRAPLVDRGKPLDALTRFERIEVIGGHSLVRVTPETSRKHQIRRHLAQLDHPVLGDARHGHAPSNRHFAEKYLLDRPFIHCEHVEITAPAGGGRLSIRSTLAPDLRFVLDRLRESGPRVTSAG
jgi:23S rRNA (uracil1939-C5)-methyltransferase